MGTLCHAVITQTKNTTGLFNEGKQAHGYVAFVTAHVVADETANSKSLEFERQLSNRVKNLGAYARQLNITVFNKSSKSQQNPARSRRLSQQMVTTNSTLVYYTKYKYILVYYS